MKVSDLLNGFLAFQSEGDPGRPCDTTSPRQADALVRAGGEWDLVGMSSGMSWSVHPKGDQSWVFSGRTDAEAPILWPPDAKSIIFHWKRP